MKAEIDSDTLSRGEMLNWYRIEGVLGRGGFGVTYLAVDTNLQLQVAIKEYLPEQIARRDANNSVLPVSETEQSVFRWGLQRFITEARTLVRFKHQNIVRVMSVFESNNTAYMVMEFEKGQDLKQLLKSSDASTATEEFLKNVIIPISHGLEEVHGHGFIHRDIKPANIYIRENRTPVLLDFGSARQALGSQTRQLTAMVSTGFAPLEQYNNSNESQQGPWTDIYALGAVLYYAISNVPPLDSMQRAAAIFNDKPDPLKPIAQFSRGDHSREFLESIEWALGFKVSDRPQSLAQWREKLLGGSVIHGISDAKQTGSAPANSAATVDSAADDAQVLEIPDRMDSPVYEPVEDGWGRASRSGLGSRKRRRRSNHPIWKYRWAVALVALIIGVWLLNIWNFSGDMDPIREEMQTNDASGLVDTSKNKQGIDANKVDESVSSSMDSAGTATGNASATSSTITPADSESAPELSDSVETKASVISSGKNNAGNTETQLTIESDTPNSNLEKEVLELREDLATLDSDDIQREKKTRKLSEQVQQPEAITSDDIQEVTRNFDQLRLAIEKKDMDLIQSLVIPSDSKTSFFEYVFATYESIDVSLTSISTQKSKQIINARLEIDNMIRANGDRAMPADAYRSIGLSCERVNGQWSKIVW